MTLAYVRDVLRHNNPPHYDIELNRHLLFTLKPLLQEVARRQPKVLPGSAGYDIDSKYLGLHVRPRTPQEAVRKVLRLAVVTAFTTLSENEARDLAFRAEKPSQEATTGIFSWAGQPLFQISVRIIEEPLRDNNIGLLVKLTPLPTTTADALNAP